MIPPFPMILSFPTISPPGLLGFSLSKSTNLLAAYAEASNIIQVLTMANASMAAVVMALGGVRRWYHRHQRHCCR
jgi:hypothetical protein